MPKMTRAHFQFIADTIKDMPAMRPELKQWVAECFADRLPRTNPGFKPERFIKACGVEE